MIKLLWAFMIMVALAIPLHAELTYEGAYNPNQNLQEYFDEAYPNYDKPIIYVFFNNDPCFQCPQTIELIEQVYNRNYQNEYSLFLINYQNDDEYNFIETYDLNQPLEVVLVDVADGQSIGYKKLENLQNQISDPGQFFGKPPISDKLLFQRRRLMSAALPARGCFLIMTQKSVISFVIRIFASRRFEKQSFAKITSALYCAFSRLKISLP